MGACNGTAAQFGGAALSGLDPWDTKWSQSGLSPKRNQPLRRKMGSRKGAGEGKVEDWAAGQGGERRAGGPRS